MLHKLTCEGCGIVFENMRVRTRFHSKLCALNFNKGIVKPGVRKHRKTCGIKGKARGFGPVEVCEVGPRRWTR